MLASVTSGQDVSSPALVASCCTQVFLSSPALLADRQGPALGIYTLSSQKIANNSHPVYVKHRDNQDFFLYFRQEDTGPQGWIVGSELLEDSYHITTKILSNCPAGISGGYDADNVSRDPDFTIQCHTDRVAVDCCASVSVSSEGRLGDSLGAIMGSYQKVGDHNGHSWYQGGHSNNSLYYRKAGHGPDGWVIGTDLEESNFFITTRDKSHCPDRVTEAFDHDQRKDSLLIYCQVAESELSQEPGIPAAPLEVMTADKAISAAGRSTLIASASFR